MAKSNKQPITVTISPQAKEDILKILDYLEQEWGQKVINDFLQKIDVFYQIILINPRLFSFHNKRKNIRKYALTKRGLLSK
ncbi:MAG: type II toxin-antitoxin system RelE/ParE family toxin [Bacteroidetes bacterium]|nr:type II toxin-antitoxin system RelE/ParE family toxin [Bacteroidota bacterium]